MEQAVAEQVGFVDDEDGAAPLLGQLGEGVSKPLAEAAGMKGGADVEGGEQVGEQSLDGEIGIGYVGGQIEVGVEGLDEGAHTGRLTGADVAGDKGGEAVLEGEGEAGVKLLVGIGGIEVLRGQRLVGG